MIFNKKAEDTGNQAYSPVRPLGSQRLPQHNRFHIGPGHGRRLIRSPVLRRVVELFSCAQKRFSIQFLV